VPGMEDNYVLNELKVLKQRMDDLYSRSFEEGEPEEQEACEDLQTWQPSMDIIESETQWVVAVDLPGVSVDDLKVEINDGHLSVEGERKSSFAGGSFRFSQAERPFGKFFRKLPLPQNVKEEDIEAEFKGGVLTVTAQREHGFSACSQKIRVQPSDSE